MKCCAHIASFASLSCTAELNSLLKLLSSPGVHESVDCKCEAVLHNCIESSQFYRPLSYLSLLNTVMRLV